VAVGAAVTVGVGVAGRAVGPAGLDPHAATPTAAIAAPMMSVSFMLTFTHSTGTRSNGYICANASNALSRVIDATRDAPWRSAKMRPWEAATETHSLPEGDPWHRAGGL
jgi:hypothetical protein